jgi:hypothetical protein
LDKQTGTRLKIGQATMPSNQQSMNGLKWAALAFSLPSWILIAGFLLFHLWINDLNTSILVLGGISYTCTIVSVIFCLSFSDVSLPAARLWFLWEAGPILFVFILVLAAILPKIPEFVAWTVWLIMYTLLKMIVGNN